MVQWHEIEEKSLIKIKLGIGYLQGNECCLSNELPMCVCITKNNKVVVMKTLVASSLSEG